MMRGITNTTTITATTMPATAPDAREMAFEVEALRLHAEDELMVPPGQKLVFLLV
jgi:hypothetical protein